MAERQQSAPSDVSNGLFVDQWRTAHVMFRTWLVERVSVGLPYVADKTRCSSKIQTPDTSHEMPLCTKFPVLKIDTKSDICVCGGQI